jgi:hypothetical protein
MSVITSIILVSVFIIYNRKVNLHRIVNLYEEIDIS